MTSHNKVTVKWLNSLSPSQLQELTSLQRSWENNPYDRVDISKIAKDWIEENGGDRWWWMSMYESNNEQS